VEKVRKFVDHVLCSLPFEPAWYHERGVPYARYVGHPYFDELSDRTLDPAFLASERAKGGPIVAILPGSRTQELTRNLPVMVKAAETLRRQRPDVRFVVAALHERHKARVEAILAKAKTNLPIEVHAARTPELIRLADVAWAVSGSVGLELMMETLPSVILYKVKRIDLVIARPFIKAKYISLVNLLADTEVMPEYLTARDVSGDLAGWAERWLGDPTERERASLRLAYLRETVASPGASERAADAIVEALGSSIRRRRDEIAA
jgi:lipid-A-disaccharide synthase